ncbi:MAG: phosphoribosylglycinamide formyltransferase [Coriobacteriales bacterium]|jgi:phosphoribosylglycinamide formyltransferase-1|nr:phosphoribosylglycinamide formyltransferase [Coriobacteriales bacterium]
MIKLGVLLSGSGSNLQAIIDAIAAGNLDASVALVVSSRPDAYGLKRAQAAGIPTVALSREVYNNQAAADELIANELNRANVNYVVMAGYMRKVTAPILNMFPNRVINIHPALLPSFAGAHGISDAWEYGVKVTGVTIHLANAEYDKGPIIAQEPVIILEDDTTETLEERIHAVEHELYPKVLQWFANDKVHLNEKTGKIDIL